MFYPKLNRFLLLALILLISACGRHDNAGVPILNWYVFNERSGAFLDAARYCSEQSRGRYRIAFTPLPADADQQREQLARRLAAADPSIDLIGMDVIWTSEFAEAGWIKPWPKSQTHSVTAGLLPAAVASATYRQRQWAIPFTSNTQLLWYRKDRVTLPPATWNELLKQAEALGLPATLQVQGQRYEGLTVFFGSLLASAGGSVLNDDATDVSLEEQPTRKALTILKRIADSPTADPGLNAAREDQNRLAFETGEPTFMLNYPFVWPSALQNAPAVAQHMAWAPWPEVLPGQAAKVTLGGINLAVAGYSRFPNQAFEAAACLASERNQRLTAVRGGLPPSLQLLYQDPKIQARFPMADLLLATLRNAALRPRTPVYNDISLAISHTLHPLSGIDPAADTRRLRQAVRRALHSKGLF